MALFIHSIYSSANTDPNFPPGYVTYD